MRVYTKENEKLKIAFKEVDYISLTTDLWTSNHTIAYMCVVAHYIDTDLEDANPCACIHGAGSTTLWTCDL
jgi:hypothetical protein